MNDENKDEVLIELTNSDTVDVDLDRHRGYVKCLLDVLDLADSVEIYINFVPSSEIQELNETYLKHTGPTDVLSFPIEPAEYFSNRFGILSGREFHNKISGHLLLGDIYICPTFVKNQAFELNVSFNDELALLLVHGLLHLMGLDHEADDEAEFMEELERKLIKRCYV